MAAQSQNSSSDDFNFWGEVIGDDLVVDGVVYSSETYETDGEGGVQRRDQS